MAVLNAQPRVMGTCPRSQTGLSLLSALYVLITLGAIVVIGVRSFPVYMNNHEIQTALDKVAQDPALRRADPIQIKRALGRHFQAGYAEGVSARDVRISSDGDRRKLELRYEVRRPLAFNLGMVYSFHDVAHMPVRTGG